MSAGPSAVSDAESMTVLGADTQFEGLLTFRGRARVDGYYYCPHHPGASVEAYRVACECRKPLTGMIRRAASDLDIDIGRSFVVGDRWRDVDFARAAGARSVLVRTGYALADQPRPGGGVVADHVSDNLAAAASWIIMGARG